MTTDPTHRRNSFSIRGSVLATGILLGLLWSGMADAATQTLSPAACSTAGGAGPGWANATRAETSNNFDATATVDGSTTEYLRCVDYGFTIPVGATINGIIVNVERSSSRWQNGGSRDAAIRIVQGGTIGADDRSTGTTYTTGDVVEAHGGATDLWGLAWTSADINAANFGAAFRATKPSSSGWPHTIRIDHIQITVDYTPDTIAPTLSGAFGICGLNRILVNFSEALDAASAEAAANYTLTSGVTVTSATLQADGRSVALQTSAMGAGTYTLAVANVTDLALNPVAIGSQAGFTVEAGALAPGINGLYYGQNGTPGAYYTGTPVQRIDGTIDFGWGGGIPVAGIAADDFSVRWTGYVLSPADGSYILRTNSDDGVRLYLNGQTLIDNWTDHGPTDDDSAPVILTANQYYPLQMDFYERGGGAEAHLLAEYEGGGFNPVPAGNFFYCAPPVAAAPGSFNAYENATAAGAIAGIIKTKIAATAFNLDLIALNVANDAIEPGFFGDVKVELLGNTATNVALDANNCPLTSTVLSTATETFIDSHAGRMSNAAFGAIPEAWRDVRVRISHPAIGVASTVACSTDRFAIRPASLAGMMVTDATWQTAGTARPLGNLNATGSNVHKAGQPFTIATTALNAASIATTNYEGQPLATVSGCGMPGTSCTVSFGAVNTAVWTPASPATGTVTTGTATYSEVGSFGLQLADTSFSDVDLADSSPAERHIPLSAKVDVGRFVPDHFAVSTDNTPQYRTYNAFDAACTAGAAPRRIFTYIGQPFGWAAAPRALVAARNAAGAMTANYSGSLWKLTGADISEIYPGAPFDASGRGLPSLVSNGDGTGIISSDPSGTFVYTRGAAQAPFNANISLTISVQDTTEAGANQETIGTAPLVWPPLASPALFNGTGAGIAFDGGGASNGTEMRYGQLKVHNTYGSELLPLPVIVSAQYWNGTAFVTNNADHCTSTVSGNFILGPGTGGLINTTLLGGTPLSSGGGKIVLTKPTGFTAKGSVTVSPSAAISGYLPGAAGHETFGIYNRGPVIYIRERY